MILFEIKAFEDDQGKMKSFVKVGPYSNRTGVLTEKGNLDMETTTYKRKMNWRHKERIAIYQ